MAVTPTSPSSKSISTSQNNKNKKQKPHTKIKKKNNKNKNDDHNPTPIINPINPQQLPPSKPVKRLKSPGVRVIGARIYDSEHGKTCHQCRQKTMDFVVSCKSQTQNKNNKQCTFRFCHKCLLNRYGEKAEELAELVDWICPKCRGICNCSFCMKKRGFHPTGILVHTAKANGFSSVSDMLLIDNSAKAVTEEGSPSKKRAAKSENGDLELKRSRKDDNKEQQSRGIIKDAVASSKKATASAKEPAVGPEKAHKNVTGLDGNSDMKSQPESLKTKTNKKDTKNTNLEGLRESDEIDDSSETSMNNGAPAENITTKNDIELIKTNSEALMPNKVSTRSIKIEDNESEVPSNINVNTTAAKNRIVDEFDQFTKTEEVQGKDSVAEIPLPQGTELTNVANIDMPAEDVGHALQFLEFCEAFGKVLDLKKGQPEMLLRDLACDRRSRRKDESSVVQFHIKLLSMIQETSGKEFSSSKATVRNPWLEGLRKCISESQDPSKESLLGFLDVGVDGYEKLDTSKKLRLLTFLCDEALGTPVLRSWIDEQNSEYVKEAKKAKETILPAQKEKEKNMKRKVQNEVARAIIMNNGVPLSIAEHENLVFKIRAEAAQTLAETLEETETLMKTLPKETPRSDAVRSEPILFDASGRIFWKLRGYDGSLDILLQDIGSGELVTCKDRWFAYDVQEKEMVENYLSSKRNL
ncbi:hypothetical protein LguiB_022622 [Lonicera macranthoides]